VEWNATTFSNSPNNRFTVTPSHFTLQPRGSCADTFCAIQTDRVTLTITAKPLAPTSVQLTPLDFGYLELSTPNPNFAAFERMTIAVQGLTDDLFKDDLETHP
jgi:hypothetical protein